MISPKILLIGCGLHAKRVYLPILKELQNTYGEILKAVVELKDAKESTTKKINEDFKNVEFCFVEQMKDSFTQSLPESIERELDKVLKNRMKSSLPTSICKPCRLLRRQPKSKCRWTNRTGCRNSKPDSVATPIVKCL